MTDTMGFDFNPEVVILGGGDFPSHSIPLGILRGCDRIVCCDGAANQCEEQGLVPWRIVGDGDSISPDVRRKFDSIIRKIPEQETNDQTKAVKYLSEHGVHSIAIVGATGRREDHTIGNISLLHEYLNMDLNVRMYTDSGMFVACRNDMHFRCPEGASVSIFSLGAKRMHSEGLAYQLYDFDRLWQGTLNNAVGNSFSISCSGDYIVFINYENRKIRE